MTAQLMSASVGKKNAMKGRSWVIIVPLEDLYAVNILVYVIDKKNTRF